MHRALLMIGFAAILVFPATGRCAEPADGAIAAAKVYISRLAGGQVKKAVTECWDADALLSASFGLMYLELPEAERKRAQSAFADFVAAPFANEQITQIFKSIAVQEATATVVSPTTVAVRLQLTGNSGQFHAVNTLLLTKVDSKWQITDQRQGDQPSIRSALSVTYISSAKDAADTIPVVLERAVAETRQQMSGK